MNYSASSHGVFLEKEWCEDIYARNGSWKLRLEFTNMKESGTGATWSPPLRLSVLNDQAKVARCH